jgi:glycosyltransferase involved in cell wall biosynthesis
MGDSTFLAGDVANLTQYLKAFDALALSSTKEGLPYSILEAGLAGVPVVATNVGGIGEIIENEKNGLLVPPRNPELLAEAILELINHTEKAGSYSAILKKNVTKRFNFENMIARTEWVYKI